jgi:HSP20 family protein
VLLKEVSRGGGEFMKLVKWDPFRELEDISNRLNRAIGRTFPLNGGVETAEEMRMFADWAPIVDIQETPEEFLIKAELPEVKKEDVKVAMEDGVLSIRGERKLEKEEKGKKYHRIERAYGTFMRSFVLPDNVNGEKVLATYKDGVLEVHLPKTAAAKPKATEVKVT